MQHCPDRGQAGLSPVPAGSSGSAVLMRRRSLPYPLRRSRPIYIKVGKFVRRPSQPQAKSISPHLKRTRTLRDPADKKRVVGTRHAEFNYQFSRHHPHPGCFLVCLPGDSRCPLRDVETCSDNARGLAFPGAPGGYGWPIVLDRLSPTLESAATPSRCRRKVWDTYVGRCIPSDVPIAAAPVRRVLIGF